MEKTYFRLLRLAVAAGACIFIGSHSAVAQSNDGRLQNARYTKRINGSTLKSAVMASDVTYTLRDAQAIFKTYLPLSAGDELRFKNETKVDDAVSIQRFTQFYQDIPVAHGAYTLTAKNGVVQSMNGNFYKTGSLNTTPALSNGAALTKALAYIGAKKYAWQDADAEARIKQQKGDITATYYPQATLTYVEDFTGRVPDGKLHLAYTLDVYALEPLSHNLYYVDAMSGKILFVDARLYHTAATGASKYSGTVAFQTGHVGASYYLHDSTRGHGIFTYNLNSSTSTAAYQQWIGASTTWTVNGGIDAHWAVSRAYDYWKNVRNRLSYDNLNGALIAYTNLGANYDNAYWDGSAMNFGSGSGLANGGYDAFVALDVVAHEMAHGVCQETAGLVYNAESGAMNEAFSDIWGSVIENYADPHEVDVVAKSTWLVGEEISGGSGLRSMKSPKDHGNPDTYLGTDWADASSSCFPSGNNDYCGVHNNSGVLNHWFYLIAAGDGGTNDNAQSFQVPGIGISDAAKIAYATELALIPTSEYADCRDASIAGATTLFGACSIQVEAVTRAWYGVGVGVNYVPCTPQPSFNALASKFTENAASTNCPASHTINMPVSFTGPALSGGNATITLTASGTSMLSGTDYTLNTPTLTFSPGGPTTQNALLTIFDNGAVDTDRYINLSMSLSAGSSNAVTSNVLTTQRITIISDDHAPVPGGTQIHYADTVISYSYVSSCFAGGMAQARSQHIIHPAELIAGGVLPNVPITAISVNVIIKSSTQPYNGYTLKMGLTATNAFDAYGDFVSGLTTVYSGNYTTVVGNNTLQLSTPFQWDGVSNMVIEACFANTISSPGNDRVDGHSEGYMATAYSNSIATASGGCALAYDGTQLNSAKPAFRFTLSVPPSPIATGTETRTWDVRSGQKVYFYDGTDSKLIAAVLNPVAASGCTEARLSKQGAGFVRTSFDTGYRSVKELTITAAQNGNTAAADVIMYALNTELAGVPATAVRLLKTTAATDAAITAANTTIVQPQLIAGTNYTGFRGSFTGIGARYFLVTGSAPLGVGTVAGNDDFIRVDNNPFQDKISLSYRLLQDENVRIILSDITGKTVFSEAGSLSAGAHQLSVGNGLNALPAGHYILRVTGARTVFTKQLLKD